MFVKYSSILFTHYTRRLRPSITPRCVCVCAVLVSWEDGWHALRTISTVVYRLE